MDDQDHKSDGRHRPDPGPGEYHFTTAISALENSPRHIIDAAMESPTEGLPVDQLKFQAAWEALRLEYQPSTVVDLSQLKDRIRALNDQGPGGFDHFKSEFLHLHTEYLAILQSQTLSLLRSSKA